MNKNILEGKWEQMKGNVQRKWGELTNDDLDVIKGDMTALAGKIKEKYSIKQEEAEKQIKEYFDSMH